MPSWLLSKPALFVGVLALGIPAFMLWSKARDNRIYRERAAEEKIAKVEAELVFARDSLATAQARTDTVVKTVRVATAGYAIQRVRVDTLRVPTGAPEIIPPGHVVVPIEFVRSADSMAVAIQALLLSAARERIASDSVIALQRIEIEQLKIQLKAGPGLQSKLKHVGVGAAIGVAAFLLLGNRN